MAFLQFLRDFNSSQDAAGQAGTPAAPAAEGPTSPANDPAQAAPQAAPVPAAAAGGVPVATAPASAAPAVHPTSEAAAPRAEAVPLAAVAVPPAAAVAPPAAAFPPGAATQAPAAPPVAPVPPFALASGTGAAPAAPYLAPVGRAAVPTPPPNSGGGEVPLLPLAAGVQRAPVTFSLQSSNERLIAPMEQGGNLADGAPHPGDWPGGAWPEEALDAPVVPEEPHFGINTRHAARPRDWSPDLIAPVGVERGRVGWRSPWVIGGVLGTLVVLAAATVATAVVPTVLSNAPSYPREWGPAVAPLAAFVAQDRGLAWKHPVEVRYLSAPKFSAWANGQVTAADRRNASTTVAEMRALGLVHGNPDLISVLSADSTAGVVAGYDQANRQIYMDGSSFSPLAETELVFALTNALDDQYYGLSHLANMQKADQSAVSALVVGDEQEVMAAYMLQELTPAQRQQAVRQMGGGTGTGPSGRGHKDPAFPFDELVNFSGEFGLPFVEILYQNGGNSAIDQAFEHPPMVESEVMDPAAYSPEQPVVSPPQPKAPRGATVLESSEDIGEAGLMEMVANEAGFTPTWKSLSGWESDQALGYRLGGRVCVVDESLFDTAAGAQGFAGLAQDWARAVPGAEVSANGAEVTLQSCDPGAGWQGIGYPAVDPYTVLLDRSELIAGAYPQLKKIVPLADLSCAVDQLIGQVGAQQFSALVQGGGDPLQAVPGLEARIAQDLTGCGWQPPPGNGPTGVVPRGSAA